jgi:hypothetical protein
MNLLVLGPPLPDCVNPAYRGTHRHHPAYVESVGQDHPANMALQSYLNASGELGVVQDIGLARKLVESFAQIGQRTFEIVQVSEPDRSGSREACMLGLDVCAHCNYSALATFRYLRSPSSVAGPKPGDSSVLSVIGQHFYARTNQHVLFSSVSDAADFLTCVREINTLMPQSMENPEVIDALEIVKVTTLS